VDERKEGGEVELRRKGRPRLAPKGFVPGEPGEVAMTLGRAGAEIS
jgi:hypothetical protein